MQDIQEDHNKALKSSPTLQMMSHLITLYHKARAIVVITLIHGNHVLGDKDIVFVLK